MAELEKREREEREKAKEEVRRAERKAREAFKDLLQQHRWVWLDWWSALSSVISHSTDTGAGGLVESVRHSELAL
jgi:trehalose/maltose hydrolase-like predicted phosphorylase